MNEVRVRVAVYVVRETARGPEVLVFDHRDFPEAGTQVPAGGVDQGENLETAAVREVVEETAVSDLVLGQSLGVQQRAHPHTGKPRVTIFYAATTTETRDRWTHVVDSEGDGDEGMVFDCYFLPLAKADGRLEDLQDEFLRLVPQNSTSQNEQ